MLQIKFIYALLLAMLFLIADPATAQKQPVSSLWEPYNALGDFYPSYALAVTNIADSTGDGNDEPNIGDPNGIMGIVFTPDRDDTRIRLQLTCASTPKLFSPVTLDVTLPEADEEYRITPALVFDQAKLASIRQFMTASITYTLTINGKVQPTRTGPLRVHPITDCPLVAIDADDDATTNWTLAAYVNEDSPGVKQVLDEALTKKYIDSFTGYQGDESSVYRQVLAVWRVLQERGIRYTNLDANAPGGTRDVPLQTVQLPDDALRSPQATCADGSVLLASLLRKMGLSPILVLIPGHLFMGFDLDEGGEKQVYLETTLLGVTPDYAPNSEKKLADQLLTGTTDPKAQAAVRSFIAAIEAGNQTYNQNRSRIQDDASGYSAVVIDEARQAGVVPIRIR